MTTDSVPVMLLCDFYKLSHREQYPDKTEVVYSTWTPRSNKYFPLANKVIAFGFQGFIKKYLVDCFNKNFFNRDIDNIVSEYKRVVKHALGVSEPKAAHIKELHKLGYLPLKIKALPEGTSVPVKVPMLTIQNTDDRFFWLTNYLETLMSTELWKPSTSATIANEYRKILERYAEETSSDLGFVQFQGHDFSMRGLSCVETACTSGAAHLTSFVGTDTIPAIIYLEKYYGADIEKTLIGTSIPATEHSVMSAGGDGGNEFDTYKRLVTEIYPNGFISIVSDTWNLWECIDKIIRPLKDDILKRDGRVVIRPDSGDPVKIICGDTDSPHRWQTIGVIELLWKIFGGIVNKKGFKELDPHIGVIYGDAITIDRCEEICSKLKNKGFASTNMVYGIGSYTYQHNTRDTFGFALKSTMCVIDGEEKMIYKNPVTDDGTKKSNIGAVAIQKDVGGNLFCKDNLSLYHNEKDCLQTIFCDGVVYHKATLEDIRSRVRKG